ncbi:hypothetical protein SEMRO_2213_G319290.1 [Seminavis robusta]|uniref:Uncharacterized protein n=1 Tax=Seminavis robusta TaxID=568900 RepID=A0A9N8EUF2_9STRA|nr:hypothetical protein SEMRO_2213_G319290.1 [Seminavis robusta]|eukprot:Sro2213_g319290.1 n/a (324) ;mRNA; r:3237-4299
MAAITITQEQLQEIMKEAMKAALTHARQATGTYSVVPGGGEGLDTTWDLTSDKGMKYFQMKYFQEATKAPTVLYDGSIEKLHHFLGLVKKRSMTYGMMAVISNINVGNNTTRAILTEYGSITQEQMKAHAETYQREDNRKRQAAKMVEALIANSIEQDVFDELEQYEEKYTVKVTPTGGTAEVKRQDGPMIPINLYDIQAFNRKVNGLIVSLRARQAQVPTLIAPLFRAYKTCEDKMFAQYFSRKEEQYEDGSLGADMEHAELIRLANEKYKIITGKKEWKQKTEHELEFMALKAEVADQSKEEGAYAKTQSEGNWQGREPME